MRAAFAFARLQAAFLSARFRSRPITLRLIHLMDETGTFPRAARFYVVTAKGKIIMKLTSIGLAAALALSSALPSAFAQTATGSATGGTSVGGSATSGTTTGSSMGGTTGSASGTLPGNNPNLNAGGAAAGANSALNPSGNSFINPSPSGSTLQPAPGSSVPR